MSGPVKDSFERPDHSLWKARQALPSRERAEGTGAPQPKISRDNPLKPKSLFGGKPNQSKSDARGFQNRPDPGSLMAWQTQKATKNQGEKVITPLSPKELEIKEFIKDNKMTVAAGLKKIVGEHKFTLIGERHTAELDPMRKEIASSLEDLKKQGLTHVGLEIPSSEKARLDGLDYSKPIAELKTEIHHPDMAEVLIAAKRAGLEVVYINKPKPDGISDKDYGELTFDRQYQNSRDWHMFDTLTSSMGRDDKALVYIGNNHVQENSTENTDDGPIYRIGTHLSQKFGNNQVGSIRLAVSNKSLDGLRLSKKPTLDKVMPNHQGFMILPDAGPIKGDPRVTASDYIITGK